MGRMRAWPGLFLAAIAVGCGPVADYRSETVLSSTGAVQRTIYQPLATAPEDAIHVGPNAWSTVRSVDPPEKLPALSYFRPLTELPAAGDEKEPADFRERRRLAINSQSKSAGGFAKYFVATGKFVNVASVPGHIAIASETSLPAARLTREYKRNDFGLVVEHVWLETMNDVATQPEMRVARRQLYTIFLDDFKRAFAKRYGAELDGSRWIQWWETEVRDFARDLESAIELHCVDKNLGGIDTIAPVLRRTFETHGISMKGWTGSKLDEEFERPIRAFLAAKARAMIVRRDGKPVAKELIDAIVEFKFAAENQTALEEQHSLQVQATGLFALQIGPRSKDEFWFRQQLPGFVAETNGTLLAQNRVEWRFKGSGIFPTGYPMRCRSIEPNLAAQVKLLGKSPVDTLEKCTRFVGLLQADPYVRESFDQCIKTKNLAPIRTTPAADTAERKNIRSQLLDLLEGNS